MSALSHRRIIGWFPSSGEFARAIGTTSENGRMMRLRNKIPARYFPVLQVALVERGYPALTYAQLSDAQPKKKRRRKPHAGRNGPVELQQ